MAATINSSACAFAGDSDLYGLGLRLGSYIQWFSLVGAYHWAPRTVPNLTVGIGILQLAMLITLVWKTSTANDGDVLYNVGALVITIFGSGGGLSAQANGILQSSTHIKMTRLSLIGYDLLVLGFGVYNIWFWFKGISILSDPPCTPYAFLFAKVDLHGWFTTFSRVFSVVVLICTVLRLSAELASLPYAWSNRGKWLFDPEHRSLKTTRGAQLNWKVALAGQCLALGIFVAAIECIIDWNHIEDVSTLASTGQLIPLIVGISGFLQVATNIYNEITANEGSATS
ncbi:hypothetical protein DOTSEDRAFT_27599 [Dothistroma septosporum NZE10]|uniref:Uncharacterized protein n=1 Tax=Dothistroma septosporum (strain NZE10 / CBS 128990) TaxID=675120 RepID=N1PF54_DOTSN|nr:hypothetical protein DOTSEDRAFT_27599 [Dothistroma septosporum NZE10]